MIISVPKKLFSFYFIGIILSDYPAYYEAETHCGISIASIWVLPVGQTHMLPGIIGEDACDTGFT